MAKQQEEIYQAAILGAGAAGSIAAYRISQTSPNIKTLLIDLGRPPNKRRRQLEGWLGCLPNSDGKIYIEQDEQLDKFNIDRRKLRYLKPWIESLWLESQCPTKIIHSNFTQSTQNNLTKHGWEFKNHSYLQWNPDDIHKFGKVISNNLESNKNCEMIFDEEVISLIKEKNYFLIKTTNREFKARKIIMAFGRGGWRQATEIFKELDLIRDDNEAFVGYRAEVSNTLMPHFNKSVSSLTKENLFVGPLNWNGSMIPEDHVDITLANFRSNENRWHSDKVIFSVHKKLNFPNSGSFQMERLAKLAFVLSNDRIMKEKARAFIKNQSVLSPLPEFKWVKESFDELEKIIPNFKTKASIYFPEVKVLAAPIELNSKLESKEIPGLFVVGESARIEGIYGAMISGALAADQVI